MHFAGRSVGPSPHTKGPRKYGGVMTENAPEHSHDLHFDTFHEYQVWKKARSRDIATGLLACFSLFGVAMFVIMIAWVVSVIVG